MKPPKVKFEAACPDCGIKITRVVTNTAVRNVVRCMDGMLSNKSSTDLECLNCGASIRIVAPHNAQSVA